MLNLKQIAQTLGGVVSGDNALVPGPGHSKVDRSLSVKVDPNAPDGFLTHSFCEDDPLMCKDYVKEKLGLEGFNQAKDDSRS